MSYLRHWLTPTILGALLYLWLAFIIGNSDSHSYLHIINVGTRFGSNSQLLPNQHRKGIVGYDSQFYFFIAQDPLLRNPDTSANLDNSLRYRRILYPLLAFLFSFGQLAWIPLSLFFINILATIALVGLAARAAAKQSKSPYLALLLGIAPGVLLPSLADLTEPLASLLLFAGMLFASSSLLFLSALAKETGAVVMGVEFLRNVLKKDYIPALKHLVAMTVLIVWSLLVWKIVHAHESTLGGHLLDPPFAPFLALISALQTPKAHASLILLVPAILTALLIVVRLYWQRDRYSLSAAAYALIGLAAGLDTWSDPSAYFRVTIGALILLYLSYCHSGDRLGRGLLWLNGLVGAFSLAAIILF